MDYIKYYKEASKEADKLEAEISLKSEKGEEKSLMSLLRKRVDDDEEDSPDTEDSPFNAARYIAMIRAYSRNVDEQVKPKKEKKGKEDVESV